MGDRNTAIYGDQLDDSMFGAGLSKDVSDDFNHLLKVNVDDSSVEIVTDSLQVKDLGITTAKLNDLAVTNAKIADDTISEAKLDVFNAPDVGKYLKYTSNGLEWYDIDVDAVLESDLIFHEIPTGSINSINTSFTIASTPVAGTVQVFLNGLLQAPGSGMDYTVSGTAIEFTKAPRTGSDLYVHYVVV